MRAAEILRKMADIIDSKESGQSSSTEITNRPGQVEIEVGGADSTNGIEGAAQVNTRSMVGPLQQKLDLMKKLAGVEVPATDVSIAGGEESCPACGHSPCDCDAEDEMSIMKRNAGIAPAATMVIADEDEPFEG